LSTAVVVVVAFDVVEATVVASLEHSLDETVDELLTVTEVSAFGEVVGLLAPATASVVQLKVPQEVVGNFEMGADGEDLVDKILDADDAELAESLLDDVVGQSTSPSLQLAESALVDKFANGFEVRITPGNVRIGDTQHAQRGLVQFDKGRVVDLTQSEQLKHLSDSWMKSVDTPDPHNDGQFGLRGDVEVAVFAGIAGKTDLLRIGGLVLFRVSLGLLENGSALGFGRFLFK